MVCYKGNGVSALYMNGRVCTLPLPVRNSRKKEILIENLLESYRPVASKFCLVRPGSGCGLNKYDLSKCD